MPYTQTIAWDRPPVPGQRVSGAFVRTDLKRPRASRFEARYMGIMADDWEGHEGTPLHAFEDLTFLDPLPARKGVTIISDGRYQRWFRTPVRVNEAYRHWTPRERAILAEHLNDWFKDNGVGPTLEDLVAWLTDRADEEEGELHRDIVGVVQTLKKATQEV